MAGTGKVLTGCRARFSLNGVKVGYATGVSYRETITWEPIKVLDTIQVSEHVPTDYDVSMTADMVRLVGEDIKAAGWFANQGATPEAHLTNLLNLGALTATIEDSKTAQIVANVEGVRISENGTQISARGVVGTNVSMVGIRVRSEADLS